jgi:hypothetical protein
MGAHFFDIDVLVDVNSKVWVISKIKPDIPVIKISKHEFKLIKRGIYKKYKQNLNIGGKSYWLPEDLMNNLKVRCKNLKCDITDLSFSMQEFMNPLVIDHLEFKVLVEHFQQLKNTKDDIYIICSKNTEKNYKKVVDTLIEKMADFGLVIKDFYYLSETFYNRDKDNISHTKVKLLLQHLIGYRSESDKFIDEEITQYDRVYFYDDDSSVISLANDCNKTFDFIVSNTEDSIKSNIKDVVKEDDKIIIVNKVTNNKVNPFITKEVLIEWSNIKKTFESFIYKRD